MPQIIKAKATKAGVQSFVLCVCNVSNFPLRGRRGRSPQLHGLRRIIAARGCADNSRGRPAARSASRPGGVQRPGECADRGGAPSVAAQGGGPMLHHRAGARSTEGEEGQRKALRLAEAEKNKASRQAAAAAAEANRLKRGRAFRDGFQRVPEEAHVRAADAVVWLVGQLALRRAHALKSQKDVVDLFDVTQVEGRACVTEAAFIEGLSSSCGIRSSELEAHHVFHALAGTLGAHAKRTATRCPCRRSLRRWRRRAPRKRRTTRAPRRRADWLRAAARHCVGSSDFFRSCPGAGHDGLITREEFARGLEDCGVLTARTRRRPLLDALGPGADGRLNRQEMVGVLEASHRREARTRGRRRRAGRTRTSARERSWRSATCGGSPIRGTTTKSASRRTAPTWDRVRVPTRVTHRHKTAALRRTLPERAGAHRWPRRGSSSRRTARTC